MSRWNKLYRKSQGFRAMLHLVYWILAWGFTNLLFGYGNLSNPYSLLFSSIILMIAAGVSYLIIYFLIPRFLLPGKYGLFLAFLVFTIIVSLDLELLSTILFVLLHEKFQVMEFFHSTRDVYSLISGTYFIVFLSVAIKLFEFWYLEQNRKQEATKQKVEAELKLLKSQIHPHFLFNTLNNIYSLALQKSELAPDAVLKLSGLLDYLIYHGENDSVPLSKETELIRNYIELENLRYGDRLDLDFRISGNPETVRVAPLLLIPLVENAFKHGISRSRGKQRLIIKLDVKGKIVDFYIENTMPPKDSRSDRNQGLDATSGTETSQGKETSLEKERGGEKEAAGGMGLANLRKRLEYIYKEKSSLKIRMDENRYIVSLKLET